MRTPSLRTKVHEAESSIGFARILVSWHGLPLPCGTPSRHGTRPRVPEKAAGPGRPCLLGESRLSTPAVHRLVPLGSGQVERGLSAGLPGSVGPAMFLGLGGAPIQRQIDEGLGDTVPQDHGGAWGTFSRSASRLASAAPRGPISARAAPRALRCSRPFTPLVRRAVRASAINAMRKRRRRRVAKASAKVDAVQQALVRERAASGVRRQPGTWRAGHDRERHAGSWPGYRCRPRCHA